MSGRTIVLVEPMFGGGANIKLDRAPVEVPEGQVARPFYFDPEEGLNWAEDCAVERQGKKIFDQLKTHPAIQTVLENVLRAPPGETRPIYFHLRVQDAERLYWETLCNDGGRFLALDKRWPIARIADSIIDKDVVIHDFRPPLKVFAVLSALGIDHVPEWEALRTAAATAWGKGLEVELSIVSGNPDLVSMIRDEIDGGLNGVSVMPLPNRTSQLESEIIACNPNVIHFFCHGAIEAAVSFLEIASANDFAEPANASTMKLEVSDLIDMLPSKDLWLVTLNCCEGGRATPNMHSMAHQLVAETSLPAAVGMLEPFDALDAREFCSGFYRALFAKVSESLAALDEGEIAPMEWADLLRSSRRNISERNNDDPVNNRQWALPVVYVRREAFQLRKLGRAAQVATPEMIRRASLVAGALRNLPPDTPEEMRTEFLALLYDVPSEFRPDRLGNLEAINAD